MGGVALMATGVGGIAGAALIGATDVLTGSVAGAVGGRIGARTTALDEVTAARRASGLTEHPLFTQTTARPEFGHGPFESRTIGEVSARIRSGEIDPSALPVDVVRRDGQVLGMNTRSMLTLRRAGVPPSEWTVRDMSGAPRVERLLDDRLMRNQLGEGVETIRITGVGSKASSLR
ncbi:MAG: hypothetical protein HYX34_07840 [Actinobacteria bacterium]|nr:hypothetical protein [Actinomycetota bacterium]